MKGEKEVRISYWAAHLTTVVSVTLLLIIMGIIALMSVSASIETRRIREKIELNVILSDSISNDQTHSVLRFIEAQPWAGHIHLITKEEALSRWTKETGENLEALFGVNPLSPEISFTLKPEYTGQHRIDNIRSILENRPYVEGVASPDGGFIDAMNRNIESITWILGAIGIVMIVISFVLINNTVHLTIYSRRFTIHTMQLVGASNGFIRRPFILGDMISGLLAGTIASGILAASLFGADSAGMGDLATFVPWGAALIVFGGLIVAGAIICALAAWMATTRYLSKHYDELFR